jgi:hypothetical protein
MFTEGGPRATERKKKKSGWHWLLSVLTLTSEALNSLPFPGPLLMKTSLCFRWPMADGLQPFPICLFHVSASLLFFRHRDPRSLSRISKSLRHAHCPLPPPKPNLHSTALAVDAVCKDESLARRPSLRTRLSSIYHSG